MDLASLFPEKHLLFDIPEESWDAVHQSMVDHLIDQKVLPDDLRSEILEALTRREQKMSTAIGHRIALPHAPIQGLAESVAVIAWLKKPLSGNTPDGHPISVFVMVLVPGNEYAAHLRTLATVSRFLTVSEVRQQLPDLTSAKDFTALVQRESHDISSKEAG